MPAATPTFRLFATGLLPAVVALAWSAAPAAASCGDYVHVESAVAADPPDGPPPVTPCPCRGPSCHPPPTTPAPSPPPAPPGGHAPDAALSPPPAADGPAAGFVAAGSSLPPRFFPSTVFRPPRG